MSHSRQFFRSTKGRRDRSHRCIQFMTRKAHSVIQIKGNITSYARSTLSFRSPLSLVIVAQENTSIQASLTMCPVLLLLSNYRHTRASPHAMPSKPHTYTHIHSHTRARTWPLQNSQTYMKIMVTAAKKPSHAFQPTPVRSAMIIMRFIVPRRRNRVESKLSFIFSANADESRISSPIATVIYNGHEIC